MRGEFPPRKKRKNDGGTADYAGCADGAGGKLLPYGVWSSRDAAAARLRSAFQALESRNRNGIYSMPYMIQAPAQMSLESCEIRCHWSLIARPGDNCFQATYSGMKSAHAKSAR